MAIATAFRRQSVANAMDFLYNGGIHHSEFTFCKRSAIHTFMIDCRVTPSRRASLSNDRIIHVGKSTFTRRCS
jgi:hypothetical protein